MLNAGKGANAMSMAEKIFYGVNDLDTNKEFGIGATTVLHNVYCLASLADNVKRVIFFDRFFTGLTLLLCLLRVKLYACGTVMVNRMKSSPAIIKETLQRGAMRLAPDLSGRVLSAGWYDNKPVHFLNTAFRASASTCKRRSRTNPSERDTVPCPLFVWMYQQFMRGVDLFDQIRSNCAIGNNIYLYVHLFHSSPPPLLLFSCLLHLIHLTSLYSLYSSPPSTSPPAGVPPSFKLVTPMPLLVPSFFP